ncbi:MAG: icmW [Gammaproteobacteria bacterium]|jgi:intracellular multiplication protein IcmW|nr:icmW [Gammaproteobacteria bacterium]
MPSLAMKDVHQFWKDYKDPTIYRVIAFMEGVENWTLDGEPDLETALNRLGQQLDTIGNYPIGQEEPLTKLACHVRMSRTLRLMQCIDSAHPGAASKLLMYAEQNSKHRDDPPGLFLRRNIVFERLRLLGRIFAAERLELALKVLEGDDA